LVPLFAIAALSIALTAPASALSDATIEGAAWIMICREVNPSSVTAEQQRAFAAVSAVDDAVGAALDRK
jgi:hypothetical protein